MRVYEFNNMVVRILATVLIEISWAPNILIINTLEPALAKNAVKLKHKRLNRHRNK